MPPKQRVAARTAEADAVLAGLVLKVRHARTVKYASKEERVTAVERTLIEVLEYLRRAEVPTWPARFAATVGLSKPALAEYHRAATLVREYAQATAPSKMRGRRATTSPEVVQELASARSEANRLRRLADASRLRAEAAESALVLEREAHTRTQQSLAVARAMVDSLDSYLAGRKVTVARQLDARLHQLAAEVTGHPVREVAAEGTSGRPRLQVLDGGAAPPPQEDV